jgi:ElaB/YqjD/DUF883 family membrane-anchored ribosome-binding protein
MKTFKQLKEVTESDATGIRNRTLKNFERQQQAQRERQSSLNNKNDIVRDTEEKIVRRVKDAVEKSKKKDKPWYELLDD